MTMSQARRQPAEVRREQILDAAEAVMLRNGLQHATVADIAQTAGLGKGTVYLQFESKQALVAGLRHRYIERIGDEVKAEVAMAGTAAQQLSAFVRTFVSASTRRPDLHHLLFQEAGIDEANAFAPLRFLFAGIVKDGGFATLNSDLAIDYTFGGIHAALISVAHAAPARSARAISQIVELVNCTLSPSGL
jgi:TetR/AcrR family transcriptional regulator, cholesterol catabolism regulator